MRDFCFFISVLISCQTVILFDRPLNYYQYNTPFRPKTTLPDKEPTLRDKGITLPLDTLFRTIGQFLSPPHFDTIFSIDIINNITRVTFFVKRDVFGQIRIPIYGIRF